MAENPTKGGVHHSAFLSRKTAPAAPSFHVRDAKVVKNRAENQPVNISSHSAKSCPPTPKSPRIPHVVGDCVRRRSNNLLGQFRKITTDFRRTFSHKIPPAAQNHPIPTVIGFLQTSLGLYSRIEWIFSRMESYYAFVHEGKRVVHEKQDGMIELAVRISLFLQWDGVTSLPKRTLTTRRYYHLVDTNK